MGIVLGWESFDKWDTHLFLCYLLLLLGNYKGIGNDIGVVDC